MKVHWLDEPEEHDYPAAESYLKLVMAPSHAAKFVELLRAAKVDTYKAKDILRAAGFLPLPLDEKNYHVAKDLKKIEDGKALSPVLLIRAIADVKVLIADGFHRTVSAYLKDEDTDVSCKIV